MIFCGIICITFFGIAPLGAQSFSKTFNPDFEMAYFQMAGYPINPTAKELFLSGNFINAQRNNGKIVASRESSSTANGVFTATLLLTIIGADGTAAKYARMKVQLQSDILAEKNYITYFYLVQLTSGNVTEKIYDGRQESLANITGMFIGMMKLFYDEDKLISNHK